MSTRTTLVLALIGALLTGSVLAAPAVAAVPATALEPVSDAVTTTTLEITPSGSARVGQEVSYKVSVSAEGGGVPSGYVGIGSAGCSNPASFGGDLGPDGTVTFKRADTAPYDYHYTACFFGDDGFTDSESASQAFSVVNAPPPAAPMITQHPASRGAVAGEQVTFAAATTGEPTPSVQWQRSTNGGGSWTNVPAATGPALQVVAAATSNSVLYRAVFTNGYGTARSRAALLVVTQSFRGYRSPAPGTKVKRGGTVTVRFQLGDRNGAALSDAVARNVPTAVQLWSGRPELKATARCAYNTSTNLFGCSLRTPSNLTTGTYSLVALTRLGNGPWVPASPVGSARNPQPLQVVR